MFYGNKVKSWLSCKSCMLGCVSGIFMTVMFTLTYMTRVSTIQYRLRNNTDVAFRYAPIRNTSQPCTLDLLRHHYVTIGNFPNDTWWSEPSVHKKELHSGLCRVPRSPFRLRTCLSRTRTRRIAVMGDSNGNLMYKRLVRLVSQEHCALTRQEYDKVVYKPRGPNPDYFTNRTDGVYTRMRACRDCIARTHTCAVGRSSIHLEFVASEFVLDNALTTDKGHRNATHHYEEPQSGGEPRSGSEPRSEAVDPVTFPCPRSLTTQQFLLKEYFPSVGYPDLILLFVGAHDKVVTTSAEMELYARHLAGMLALYVPSSTRVVVFGKQHEEEELKPERWKGLRYEGRGTGEQTQELNAALARGMRDAPVFPFFDLYQMSKDVASDWGSDGVHKKPAWYQAVLTNFFRIYCNQD